MWKIYGLDIEDDGNGNFVGGVIYDGEKGKFFSTSSISDLKREITRSKYHESVFVGHNIEYDLSGIFGNEPSEHFSQYVRQDSSFKSARLEVGNHGKSIRFWDTMNHYRKSLAELGDAIGLPKLEDAGIDKPWAERVEYCIRDAEIACRAAMYLQSAYEKLGSSFRATIGGSAMELYQRHFMDPESAHFAMRPGLIWKLKKGYYGGRTEIFRFGLYAAKNMISEAKKLFPVQTMQGERQWKIQSLPKPIHSFDVNSLYPFCMLQDFPQIANLIERNNPAPSCLGYEGISDVSVIVADDTPFPLLPYRGRVLCFPVGKWRALYPNNLLRYAEAQGLAKIEKIHWTCSAIHSAPYLSGFVKTLYARRLQAQKEKDDIMDLACKLLMNNLYGKFGTVNRVTDLVNPGLVDDSPEFPVYTNIIWPSMITAKGYCIMNPLFDENTFYTDTDSLDTIRALSTSNALGALKEEKKSNFTLALYALLKYYYKKSKSVEVCRAKGFPKAAAKHALRFGSATFKAPVRLLESKRRHLPVNVWIERTRMVSAEYDKRVIFPDGRTRPLTITEVKETLK